MNLHDVIKQIENDSRFIKLLQLGVISLTVIDKKVYYERYIQEMINNKKMQAISNAAEEYGVHENTIRNAIKFMERN